MKIAICKTDRGGFTPGWIEYCKNQNIDYKVVDPYASDVVEQVRDCDIVMWHHAHFDYRDALLAKSLLASLEMAGKTVFPDHNTGWHFDDKVGEKYMLEALGLPLVPSFTFYTKREALDWAAKTDYPKVFKLRGGASSQNVKLARSRKEANKLINKAFSGGGYAAFSPWVTLRERWRKFREGKASALDVCKSIARIFMPGTNNKMLRNEKGYAYFQEFMPRNEYDMRITVLGGASGNIKAFGFRRMVRKGDFRASGSGSIVYDGVDPRAVRQAIDAARAMKSQLTAFDFIFDPAGNPLIVETSYGFVPSAVDACRGYWDATLAWHEAPSLNISAEILNELLAEHQQAN